MASPWAGPAQYVPDEPLLAALLDVPVQQRAVQASGRPAKAVDVWIAHELRRAGIDHDAVWPRPRRPRVLPRSVQRLLASLPAVQRAQLETHLAQRNVFPAEARVLGEFKSKQIDVLMADWDRGVELMVSTKTMLSSYRNNLANRYEEFIGEIRNLRGRYPLASIGLVWLVRSNILNERGALEYLVDVVRNLREMDEPRGYDAGAVVVGAWDPPLVGVSLEQQHVPEDLRLGPFLRDLVDALLSRTPLTTHVAARALHP
jgi:hypothetical protein